MVAGKIDRQKVLQEYMHHKPYTKMLKLQIIIALLFQIQNQIYQLLNLVVKLNIFHIKILVGRDRIVMDLKHSTGKLKLLVPILIKLLVISIFGILI